MSEDAYCVAANYVNDKKLLQIAEEQEWEDGDYNMCKAIQEMVEDGRKEGRELVKRVLILYKEGYSVRMISEKLNLNQDEVEEIVSIVREIGA